MVPPLPPPSCPAPIHIVYFFVWWAGGGGVCGGGIVGAPLVGPPPLSFRGFWLVFFWPLASCRWAILHPAVSQSRHTARLLHASLSSYRRTPHTLLKSTLVKNSPVNMRPYASLRSQFATSLKVDSAQMQPCKYAALIPSIPISFCPPLSFRFFWLVFLLASQPAAGV